MLGGWPAPKVWVRRPGHRRLDLFNVFWLTTASRKAGHTTITTQRNPFPWSIGHQNTWRVCFSMATGGGFEGTPFCVAVAGALSGLVEREAKRKLISMVGLIC